MSKCVTYYLNFHSPLHLGAARGWVGGNRNFNPCGHPLFSDLSDVANLLWGSSLSPIFWLGTKRSEPFLLTSAFPFAGDIRFFPKPLIALNVEMDDDRKALEVKANDNRKKLKRVRYLSERRFRQIANGAPIAFDENDLINSGQLWIHGDDKCSPTVWTTDKRPRVTLDRQSSASEIWHLGGVKFHEGCGLWFDAKFDTEETQTQVETILRVLGDTGIGGERNAGYGLFDIHRKPAEPQSEEEMDRFVTLSPICPRNADELDRLIQGGDIGYTLEERSGWIGSIEGNGLRRQQIWLFGKARC